MMTGQDVVIQPDGKIVVVGDTGEPNTVDGSSSDTTRTGAPDTSFGSGGKVVSTLMPGQYDRFVGVAIQADGKIVVCGAFTLTDGSGRCGRFLARYNANGSLDTGFGTGGRIRPAIHRGQLRLLEPSDHHPG